MKEMQKEFNNNSSWGEETYLKVNNVENFTDVLRFMTTLPSVTKSEFKHEVIMYIAIFVCQLWKAVLNLRSVVKTCLNVL